MQIRKAIKSDAPTISSLLTESAERFFANDFTPAGYQHFLTEITPDEVLGRLSGNYVFWVAEEQDKIIGVCAVKEKSHLYYLFTSHEHQRKGVARSLWESAKQFMLANGAEKITVNASNFAVPAYERLGFRCVQATQEKNGIYFNPMIYETLV